MKATVFAKEVPDRDVEASYASQKRACVDLLDEADGPIMLVAQVGDECRALAVFSGVLAEGAFSDFLGGARSFMETAGSHMQEHSQ